MRLHKGIHQTEHLERLLRLVRVRPGNLDLYLELVGLENVRRAVYRAAHHSASATTTGLIGDLEAIVGTGNVRLRGQSGATARVDSGSAPIVNVRTATSPALVAQPASTDSELDESLLDDSDDV